MKPIDRYSQIVGYMRPDSDPIADLIRNPDGDVVLYKDVEALQSEHNHLAVANEALQARVRELEGEVSQLSEEVNNARETMNGEIRYNTDLRNRVRELEKTILMAHDMLEYKDYGAAFIQLSNRRLAILNGDYLDTLKKKGTRDTRTDY